MPVQPPDASALAQVADGYGLGLGEADIAQFSPLANGLLASWDVVEELYAQTAPTAPERAWTRRTWASTRRLARGTYVNHLEDEGVDRSARPTRPPRSPG